MYLMTKKLKGNNLNNTIEAEPALPIKLNDKSIPFSADRRVFELSLFYGSIEVEFALLLVSLVDELMYRFGVVFNVSFDTVLDALDPESDVILEVTFDVSL